MSMRFTTRAGWLSWVQLPALVLMMAVGGAAQTEEPQQLLDLYPGATGSNPDLFTNVNTFAFFRANHPDYGSELWASDGTPAGTQVLDIRPGSASSAPAQLFAFAGVALFVANGGESGVELWRSDGSPAGTWQVADIRAGGASSFPSGFARVGNEVFFSADGGEGRELWVTDGTTAGTRLVRDIQPGSGSSSPQHLTHFDGAVYFVASDGIHGAELWRSDGTLTGTVLVRDIQPGPADGVLISGPNLVPVEQTLYLRADDGISGVELWRTDGTAEGTALVADVRPGPDGSEANRLFGFAGLMFFSAGPVAVGGRELWLTDGTAEGTVPIVNIQANTNMRIADPPELTAFGDHLYFRGQSVAGTELWRTDGSSENTALVADLLPGASGSTPPKDLTVADGALYFAATSSPGPDYELWRTDGTAAGTQRLADINPGDEGSDPDSLTSVRDTLLFAADDGSTGSEPWILAKAPSPVAAAMLPASRSVQVASSATAFATLLNTSSELLDGCRIELATDIDAVLSYAATDPLTNLVTGEPDTPVSIAAGAGQTFVVSLTPSGPVQPVDVRFRFRCADTPIAPIFPNAAINTLLFSASEDLVPDIIAQGITPSGDGILDVPVDGSSAFAVGGFNVGATADVMVSADSGDAALPLDLQVCQTDPVSGVCTTAVTAALQTTLAGASSASFAVFANASAEVPFDPARHRIVVRFRDADGELRGATSVAVRTN